MKIFISNIYLTFNIDTKLTQTMDPFRHTEMHYLEYTCDIVSDVTKFNISQGDNNEIVENANMEE